jgi:MraZ protein
MVAKWSKVEQIPLKFHLKCIASHKIPLKQEKGERKMSFVGSYKHSLDAKKRVFIPSKFRDDLGDEFYITRKFDTYLSIYTADEWQAYVEKIEKLPESEAVEIQDFLLGAAQKCVPDSSGRIILDEQLAKHAGIVKNIVFVGVGKQIRIWAEEIWSERESTRNLEQMRAKMMQYGL